MVHKPSDKYPFTKMSQSRVRKMILCISHRRMIIQWDFELASIQTVAMRRLPLINCSRQNPFLVGHSKNGTNFSSRVRANFIHIRLPFRLHKLNIPNWPDSRVGSFVSIHSYIALIHIFHLALCAIHRSLERGRLHCLFFVSLVSKLFFEFRAFLYHD